MLIPSIQLVLVLYELNGLAHDLANNFSFNPIGCNTRAAFVLVFALAYLPGSWP